MDSSTLSRHPVLHQLAAIRAARDFGLDRDELDVLSLRFPPAPGSVDKLAEAAAAALLDPR